MATGKNIKKIDVQLPNEEDSGKLAFILLNVFTKEEFNIGLREVLMTDVRNNDRCIIDDVNMANILFELGLNERLRFLRYDPGQQFKGHMDGVYQRSDGSGEISCITIQLYLNDNYKGGETTFISYCDKKKNFSCKPRTGMVLVFEHRLFHEGSLLKKGRKYTVRTDVMYRP
ncbi:unnamed protein product [Rotaria sp. Silwood1]|nr:unnamed protein product [Rotaria sp. Silwood1]CAF1132033.1 unnamed protein product [Rotaria sp. Silwood1]CAF3504619.1 unnamed protein product [Rotaria sp. Silwood1]CAF4768481.1 unnamed protein product [Rotaria sp. Silwood1]